MSVSSNSICMCVWEGRMGERERKEKREKEEDRMWQEKKC